MSKYFQVNTREYDFANASTVTVAAASAASAAMISSEVLVTSTTDCWITVGAAPVAVAAAAAMMFLPAGCPLHLRLTRGFKVAFIQAAAGGFASVVPC